MKEKNGIEDFFQVIFFYPTLILQICTQNFLNSESIKILLYRKLGHFSPHSDNNNAYALVVVYVLLIYPLWRELLFVCGIGSPRPLVRTTADSCQLFYYLRYMIKQLKFFSSSKGASFNKELNAIHKECKAPFMSHLTFLYPTLSVLDAEEIYDDAILALYQNVKEGKLPFFVFQKG